MKPVVFAGPSIYHGQRIHPTSTFADRRSAAIFSTPPQSAKVIGLIDGLYGDLCRRLAIRKFFTR